MIFPVSSGESSSPSSYREIEFIEIDFVKKVFVVSANLIIMEI